MKMKKCPACGKEVAKSAKICPNCGKKLKKPILLFVILGIIALVVIGALMSGQKEAARKKDFTQNETATFNDVNYSITKVERSQGTEFFKPKEGKEYIIVTIKIENKSKEKIPYNAMDWKIVDSTGDENSYTLFGGDNNTDLNSGDLNASGVKTGTVAFEVPKGDKVLTLKYYDNIFSEDYSFQFKLN